MKKTSKISIAVIVLIAITTISCSTGGTDAEISEPSKVHVFALMGQSNMVGVDYKTTDREEDERIMFLDLTNELQVVKDSLYSESSDYPEIQNLKSTALGISFADEMIEKYPNDRIILVPCARGASSIYEQIYDNQFNPLLQFTFHKSLVSQCIERINDALNYDDTIFDGVLYYQGESDVNTPKAWEDGMEILLEDLHEEFGDFKFVFAQIGANWDTNEGHVWEWNNFQEAQVDFASKTGYAMVVTKDLPLIDGIHLTADSMITVGKRFAEKF